MAVDDVIREIDLIVDQASHAVHGGWELRNGIIICAWDGEAIARAPGDSDG